MTHYTTQCLSHRIWELGRHSTSEILLFFYRFFSDILHLNNNLTFQTFLRYDIFDWYYGIHHFKNNTFKRVSYYSMPHKVLHYCTLKWLIIIAILSITARLDILIYIVWICMGLVATNGWNSKVDGINGWKPNHCHVNPGDE